MNGEMVINETYQRRYRRHLRAPPFGASEEGASPGPGSALPAPFGNLEGKPLDEETSSNSGGGKTSRCPPGRS